MVWLPIGHLTATSMQLAPVNTYVLALVGCGMVVHHTPS
jgi:hypothetical protein